MEDTGKYIRRAFRILSRQPNREYVAGVPIEKHLIAVANRLELPMQKVVGLLCNIDIEYLLAGSDIQPFPNDVMEAIYLVNDITYNNWKEKANLVVNSYYAWKVKIAQLNVMLYDDCWTEEVRKEIADFYSYLIKHRPEIKMADCARHLKDKSKLN